MPGLLGYAYGMRFLLLSLFISCSVVATETGYRVVHPDGTVEFSDKPIPQGEEIKLREAPTIQFVPATPSSGGTSQSSKPTKEGAALSSTVTITSPQPDETLWADGSGVTVSVSVIPALQGGQTIAISLDGKLVATGSGTSFRLAEVYRGTHSLSASIIAVDGSVVSSSSSVSFHMRQHTSIKRRPPPDTSPHYDPIIPE
jgi:hypothetical protein